MWMICRVAFRKGKTKLLVRGIQDAEWVFCPMVRNIKNDKVLVQCCNKCAHFVRFENNTFSQTQTKKVIFAHRHPASLHFIKAPAKRCGFRKSATKKQYPSLLGFREEKQPIVDVFEEDEYVIVLAELPGMNEKDVNMNVGEDFVTITAENDIRKYLEKIKLPASITEDPVKFIYKNNILQARLKKRQLN